MVLRALSMAVALCSGTAAYAASTWRHHEAPPSDATGAVDIQEDRGGRVVDYALRMFELRDSGKEVRFEGRCDSACTLFLGLPKDQTCIGPGAYFRFHAPSAPSAKDVGAVQSFMMHKYPGWVRSWLTDQGGLSGQLLTMDYAYARRYMRTCA